MPALQLATPAAIAVPRWPLTPGAYIKARRAAALLTVADVARQIATEPRWPVHLRVEWIERIEADVAEASFATIVALRTVFPFDLHVLATLEAHRRGISCELPPLCRVCACSEFDPCFDEGEDPCGWVEPDLCSACVGPRPLVIS